MKVRKIPLLTGLSVLLMAVLACTIDVGGPAYPNQPIPVSTEAVDELLANVQAAVASGAESGQVTLVVTEPQLTSYLAAQLQPQVQPLLSDPQVYLRNGQIQIYGTATQGYFQVNILIIVTAGVDSQGQVLVDISTADFGPMPVPAGLKDTVTAAIQEAYTGAIGPAAIGFRLESITVANGTMTIVGRTK
jgi:hypothetical protein